MCKLVDDQAQVLLDALQQEEGAKAEAKSLDKEVNALEYALQDDATDIISKYPMPTDELRFSLMLIKVAASLERMGDMAKRAVVHSDNIENKLPKPIRKKLAEMVSLTRSMLAQSVDLLTDYDHEKVADMIRMEVDIDKLYGELHIALQQDMVDHPKKVSELGEMLMIAKYIERMADNAFNLIKHSYFIHTGKRTSKTKKLTKAG
jgi:phosphate transport system protein